MKPTTFEELFSQIQIDADNQVIYNKEMYLKQALEIHQQHIKDLKESNNEWELSFDLYHKALLRGTELFRKINPDYPVSTYPDTGNMIESLCDKIQELQSGRELAIRFIKEKRKDTPGMGALLAILNAI